MTTRHRKLVLNLAAGTLWATTAGLVAAGMWLPVTAATSPGPAGRGATRPATTTAPFDFGELADLDLRKPLSTEGAAMPVAVAEPTPPAPPLRLRGTVVEPGHAYAIFATPTGGTELKRVGDRVGPAVVTAVLDGTATVQVNGGQPIVLTVPHPPATGGT